MAVRVTIEARSRAAAEVVARRLGAEAQAASWRGLGVIRVVAKDDAEATEVMNAVSSLMDERHDVGWVRVRYDDQSRVFRSKSRRAS